MNLKSRFGFILLFLSAIAFADCNPWVRPLTNDEKSKFIEEAQVPREMTWYIKSEVSLPEMFDNVSIHKTAIAHMFPVQTSERVCTTIFMRYIYPDKGEYALESAEYLGWEIGKWQREKQGIGYTHGTKIYVKSVEENDLECKSINPIKYFVTNNVVERDIVKIHDLSHIIREKANQFDKSSGCKEKDAWHKCLNFEPEDSIISGIRTKRPFGLDTKPSPIQYEIGFRRNHNKCHGPKYAIFDMVDDIVQITNVWQPIY